MKKILSALCLALHCFNFLSAIIDDDFIKAAADGDLSQVQSLLDHGANIHASSFWASPDDALRQAAENGHLPVVEFLFSKGANNPDSLTNALICVARDGHLPIVAFLVSKVTYDADSLTNALIYAVRNGHLDVAVFLVNKVVYNPNSLRKALIYAARNGHLDIVVFLVNKVVYSSHSLTNALIVASENGHLPVIVFLSGHGADIHAGNHFRASDVALLNAAENGHLPLVAFLVGNGADIHARGFFCPDAPLRQAARYRHLSTYILLQFCSHHGFEEFRDNPEEFMRHELYIHPHQLVLWATVLNRPEIVHDILEQYPDAANAAYITPETGTMTALMFAAALGFEDIINILLQAGANTKITNKEGKDALKLAADYGQSQVATKLLIWQQSHKSLF